MKNLILIMTVLCPIFGFGQQEDPVQTIRGTIIDQQSQAPLIGANVIVIDSDPFIGSSSDMDGKFRLENVPVGRQTIRISYLGYEPREIPNVLVTSGKEMVMTIGLQESLETLKEVVIESDAVRGENINQMATVSARTFAVEETKRYAGALDDPSRMASSYAGVGVVDGNNDLIIRGNSPRGMQWRMEGIEIPNPNHFSDQGATGGPIAMMSSNMMSNSEFFTGAFPAEYGNAYSGVFDINLRKGNNEQREYTFGLGILGTDLAAEGPFSKNYDGSYLINYRYSTLSMFSLIGLNIVGDVIPKFQDLSYNINLPAGKAGNFSVFGLLGNGVATEEWRWKEFDYSDKFIANMGVTGIKHTYLIGSKTLIKTTAAIMGTERTYKMDQLDTLGTFIRTNYNEDMKDMAFRGTTSITHKFNARHTLKSGIIFNQMLFDYQAKYYDRDLAKTVELQNADGQANRFQSYAQWQMRATPRLTINTGVHHTYFEMNDQHVVEPRAGIRYQLAETKWINAGFGMHSATHDPSVYYAKHTDSNGVVTTPNKDLGMTRSTHYVLGYEQMFGTNIRAKVEVYYQQLFDVPVEDDPNSWVSGINSFNGYNTAPMVNKGTGENYGAEITVERYFTNQWFFMATSSLYNSTYKAMDGKTRSTRWNGNYVNNFQGGKEFNLRKPGRVISASSKVIWAGGQRFTPILLDESIAAGYEVRDENNIYGEQMPDFLRLDVQLTYRIDRPKTTHFIKLDVQNATNRSNYFFADFNTETNEIEQSTMVGILPIITYKVQF